MRKYANYISRAEQISFIGGKLSKGKKNDKFYNQFYPLFAISTLFLFSDEVFLINVKNKNKPSQYVLPGTI